MKTLIILTVIGAAIARPGLVYVSPVAHTVVAPPAVYKSQYHSQDELGQVSYGFAHPNQVKNEVRDAHGNVAGSYSYIDNDGKQVIVQYTAGEGGFKVKSNNLPVAPGIPESSPLQTIEDTAEVQAAKKEFFERFESLPAPIEVVQLEQKNSGYPSCSKS